ncbi:MAG: hypothetical protein PHY47_00810 [Lachnospiraceae bacterium]|nr:hypothetical protein [Lachnospiraceae bacterium]
MKQIILKVLVVIVLVFSVVYVLLNAEPDTKVVTDAPADCGFTKTYEAGFLTNNKYKCNK